MIQTNLFTKQRVTDIEKKLIFTKGERVGGMNQEFGMKIYTLLYIK